MSPQTTEEGGLAFARNMKLDDDGNLVSDYGYKDITCTVSNDVTPAVALNSYDIVGHIVGLDNKIYFFTSNNKIIEYDEVGETATKITTTWTYSGGEIDGYVNTNQSGETILTIGEYVDGGSDIPLKHINLKEEITGGVKTWPFANVEESLYTQAPKAPTANLVLKDTYVKTIPNGVYVFFIRYKIRKDVYTNWFLCSRPIFGGTSEKITTLQGGLQYINLHRDSAKSFIFQIDFLASNANIDSYEEFQLGFIITHDEATDARTWKHFNRQDFVNNRAPHYKDSGYDDENLIYFDYEDVEEANIDDLLETTYELYNVRNVTAFKNKLYISNYKETNFNPSEINGVTGLKSFINLQLVHNEGSDINYKNMSLAGVSLYYDNDKGFYTRTADNYSIQSILGKYLFNFDVTKLSKVGSKEKNDVVKFDVFWDENINPDIALVYNIYNNLYNKCIFGNDDNTPIPTSYTDDTELSRVGLRLIDSGTNAYIYGPRNTLSDSTNHPWYNLGFSFGFGSYKSNEVGVPNYKLGCSVFNAYTFEYDYAYISGHESSKKGWFSRDSGFSDFARSTIENTLQREIEGRSFFAKAYIEITSGANVYYIGYKPYMSLDNYAGNIMNFNIWTSDKVVRNYQDSPWDYYNDTDLEILNPNLLSTTVLDNSLKYEIINWAYELIHNNVIGIDENGVPVLDISAYNGPNNIRANSISIKFKKIDFKLDNEDIDTSVGRYAKRFKISMTTTDYISVCTFSINDTYIAVNDNASDFTQQSTLMPFSTYQAYIHFVDEHNIITNGVKLQTISTGSANSDVDILSLQFKRNNGLPATKYKSFFISLVNTGNLVIEGFNYSKNSNSTTNILHSVEVDALLYNINDNITIIDETGTLITSNAKYYSSASNYPPLAFGNCGYVSWESNTNYFGKKLYIVITRNKNTENKDKLIKASGYIPLAGIQESWNDLPDGYYGSWFCMVRKPSFELSSSCYVSGKDVYAINRNTALALSEFNSFIEVQNSLTYVIRSNFNLNYLSLTEDINDSIFAIGSASSGVKQVARVINSAILSFIYELKSMYKDFSNKTFRAFDTDYKIQFDNTVRVSHVLSDETFNNSVFKFTATDYYNIPTNRGIVVNLFAIGNSILVHTERSLYKFDGNTTIASNNQDIQLQESEPFDAGISQIFDSEYGYGGIHAKQAGCITFDSYFFYDKESNHIFGYNGNAQVQMIDGNIYKLLAYYKPSDCKTLHDEFNCRILFEFTSSRSEHTSASYKTFTLSYNYKTKSFVSFHDLSLVNTFASKHKAYSYKGALLNLFDTDSAITTTALVAGMNINKIFGNASTACIIEFGSKIYKKQATPFGIAVVMLPKENIKEVVDSVKYIANIQQVDLETQASPIYDVLVNPQVTRINPVVNFYIVTDSCVSSLVTTNVDDTVRPNNLLDYKGFKYDMGFWTSNYFRNNINKTDIYKYGQKYPTRGLDADQNSLVYGRYFIFVFDFKADTPIKFEEIYMNSDKY